MRATCLPALHGQAPQVRAVRAVPAGDLLTVAVPAGCRTADLESGAEALAAAMAVRELRVSRDRGNAQLATVLVVRRDPFDVPEPAVWPAADAPVMSLWEPVPVGVDELGRTVMVSLPERNVLLGGEPGAGKSAALSVLVASAALDPRVRVWLLDGKLVELSVWAPCAQRLAGPDIDEAIELLRELRGEMESALSRAARPRAAQGGREDGLPLHLVACDELAFYLGHEDRKKQRSSPSCCVISSPAVARLA